MAEKPNAAPADDWRKSVLQSYRNNEVVAIAKVLADLETSESITPTSKMELAWRFEDSIFKAAKSLPDYRKKIERRLNKVRKNFKPKAEPAKAEGADNTDAKEELKNKLKQVYGNELRYIAYNADAALEDLRLKLGPEKANKLKEHTDSCEDWAVDLGVLSEEELADIRKKRGNTEENMRCKRSSQSLSFSQLQRIEQHLQARVKNIRSYVVKHADPHRFMQETLLSRDVTFSKHAAAGNMLRDVLRGMISTQKDKLQQASDATSDRTTAAVSTSRENDEDPLIVLQKALEKALVGVPPPTRQDSRQLEASLRHLDKMRAASTAMMNYWLLPGDQRLTSAPRESLEKVFEVIDDGMEFVLEAVKKLEQQKRNKPGLSSSLREKGTIDEGTTKVSLQDAWSKTIELPSNAPIVVDDESTGSSSNKRPRTNSFRPYYKTRILFRPNRRTPPQLLAAIRRKGAHLKLANSGDTNAIHLVLDFDTAFSMTIYFSPLTVTLRAKAVKEATSGNDTNSEGPTATWHHLSHGLTPWGSTLDSSDFLHRRRDREEQKLSVWGVTGSYDDIGRVVEERLRDASTHATSVLRQCFRNKVEDKTIDYEVELLEGSALLEFLRLSRSTYTPHWEDKDI